MAALTQKTPSGWRRWLIPATTIQSVIMPDASFPSGYTPSQSFWIKSIIDHCDISWLTTIDLFGAYALSGGTTSLIGAGAGLDVINQLKDITFASVSFGSFGSAVGPRFGYCLGTEFKQHVYIRFDVQNEPYSSLLLYRGVELLENGRFKRIYLKEGEIVDSKVENEEVLLSLGIDKSYPPPTNSISGQLNISNSSGKSFSLDILSVKDNWDIVVRATDKQIPQIGDHYELDDMWCLEDPYLLTGYWIGTENIADTDGPTSGNSLFMTEHNKPYLEEYFTGVYIWKAKSNTNVANLPKIYQPVFDKDMSDEGGYEWTFLGFGNSKEYSDTYPDDVRYNEVKTAEGNTEYIARTTASKTDLETLTKMNPSYIRIEISQGGYRTRHNWHAPALKGSYLVQNNKKFKIVSHITADIIDVSYISIDQKTKLSIDGSQPSYIFNQYAWMITEDYYESTSFERLGALEGTINSVNKLDIVVVTEIPTNVAVGKKNNVSMLDRYINEVQLPSTLTKMYKKQEGWRLVTRNGTQYIIDSIKYGDIKEDNTFQMKVSFSSEIKGLTTGQRVWVDFDYPYSSWGRSSSKAGYSFDLSISASAENVSNSFINSDKLCLEGEYQSIPYKVDISNNTRIGICDGYLFGLGANGSSKSKMGVVILVSVRTVGRGIASLFNLLTQEGFIFYNDPVTNKLTARIGALDFKENPRKEEVVIGKTKTQNIETVSLDGNEIVLNTNKERLRRLTINAISYEDGQPPSILFGIGNPDNTYGFLVSGDGIIDLQMLRYQKIPRGKVPSSTYVDEDGESVSPVYVYKQSSLQDQKYLEVSIGTETKNSIFVKDGDIDGTPLSLGSDVRAHYINNNQTLENNNFFDAIKIPDGETLVIYGYPTSSFNLDGNNLNNSSDNNSKWYNDNAVYMVGSINDGYNWETPLKFKNLQNQSGLLVGDNEYQFPIMILNSVEYLACIHNPYINSLSIFVKAFSEGSSYLGCLNLSTMSLTHTLYKCNDKDYSDSNPEKYPLSFFYRPPLFKSDFVQDVNKSWIHGSSDIINSSFNYDNMKPSIPSDSYIRVMGPDSTKSMISFTGDISIISTAILSDGTYILLYDDPKGVQAIYSSNQGQTWVSSNIVLARNGKNAVIVGEYLFYITSDGIVVKHTSFQSFLADKALVIKKSEGNNVNNLEIEEQDKWDNMVQYRVSSGAIESQRLSGYISPEHYYRIFYYDESNRLKCYGSNNGSVWGVLDNF